MKILNSLFLLLSFPIFFIRPGEISDPRGAIIIADMKGAVTVTNNMTGAALPAASVQPSKILFDGHTIKTAGKEDCLHRPVAGELRNRNDFESGFRSQHQEIYPIECGAHQTLRTRR